MDDVTFERDVLARLAAAMAYPPTPTLRGRVLAAIATPGAPAIRQARPAARRWVLAAVVAALATGIALAVAVPSSRSAIADYFGISGSKIEILPTAAPGVTSTPFPTPAGIERYATPAALDAAQAAAGFPPALPAGEGEPQATYLVDYGPPPAVVLHYERFDLWESRAYGFYVKGVPAELIIRDFTINGRPATLIRGGAHIVRYVDASGNEVAASVRTVERTTLIWNGAQNFYRLETDLPEAAAIDLATSLP